MKYYYIYVHICLATGKPYIGWSATPKRRWRQHCAAKDNTYFHNAIRKYGEGYFETQILFRTTSLKEVKQKEIDFIKHFDALAPNGYNLTKGGEGVEGFKFSKEQNEKNSKRLQGRKCPKHSERMQGNKNASGKRSEEIKAKMRKPKSKEHKENLRKAHLGKNKGDKNGSYKNGNHTKEAKRKRLEIRLKKLEQELLLD